MSARRRGPRRLSEEERKLWQMVSDTVAPLKPVRRVSVKPAAPKQLPDPEPAKDALLPKPEKARRTTVKPSPPLAPRTQPIPNRPAIAPVERRTERKLARGRMEIDSRLDLHGMRQDAAHRALRSFLLGAQARGDRIVLVITGKGHVSGQGDDAGVLRRSVPRWLEAADLRPLVVGMSVAHRSHGGGGALYVQIRRRGANK